MSSQALSRRYARALLSLAQELDQEAGDTKHADLFAKEIQAFSDVLNLSISVEDASQGSSFGDILLNPSLNSSAKASALDSVLERVELNKHVSNFIRLVQSKNRMSLFHQIVSSYQTQTDKISGRIRASVTTALDLDMAEKDDIRQTLAAAAGVNTDQIFIEYSIDPEIIGGVVARVGNLLYDASVRSRLTEIKSSLLNS